MSAFNLLVLKALALRNYLFGQCLIRPIAICSTLRRLVAEITCRHVPFTFSYNWVLKSKVVLKLRSTQVITSSTHCKAMEKLNFSNAYNSEKQDYMPESVLEACPISIPLYSVCIFSSHQPVGDPLCHLIFCLTLHRFFAPLSSTFWEAYLDDIIICGRVDSLHCDTFFMKSFKSIGLALSLRLRSTADSFQNILPSVISFALNYAYLWVFRGHSSSWQIRHSQNDGLTSLKLFDSGLIVPPLHVLCFSTPAFLSLLLGESNVWFI